MHTWSGLCGENERVHAHMGNMRGKYRGCVHMEWGCGEHAREIPRNNVKLEMPACNKKGH